MAKNNNNNGVENKNKNKDGGEKKKAIAPKIVKWVKSFQGAESVKSEGQANKLTVVGKVDPTKLRDELATTTKNKVDLVSPQPKKDNKVNKDDANDTKEKKPEKTDNDEKAKEAPFTTAVVKTYRHCQECASRKVQTLVRKTEGCDSVSVDMEKRLLTVTGSMDVQKLVSHLRRKLKKPVAPKKKNGGNEGNDGNGGGGGGGADDTKKRQPEKTDDDEKPKEAPLSTAVMKMSLHCQGCIGKLRKLVSKTEGFYDLQIDRQKYLVTVTGSMDVQELAERLKEKLKRTVEIVPPPKKKNGGNDGNSGNDGNDGDDGNDGNDGSGDEKKKKEDEGNGGGKMKYPAGQSGFGQFPYETVYRHGYGYQNGALKMGENMLLLCCEVFGLLVMYSHLPKDIYTNVTLNTQ